MNQQIPCYPSFITIQNPGITRNIVEYFSMGLITLPLKKSTSSPKTYNALASAKWQY